MEFHRCLRIVARSKEMLTAPSSVVWHGEWLLLRLDCTLLTNKPACTSLGLGLTTQWNNSGSKLNTIARCSRSKIFILTVQKDILEVMTRDMHHRKTEA